MLSPVSETEPMVESTTSVTQPVTQESMIENLNKLERAYVERATLTRNIKEQLMKIQDQLLASQDSEHRAFQNFTNSKEQYLVMIIKQQKNELDTSNSTKSTSEPDVPDIVESRTDNVE